MSEPLDIRRLPLEGVQLIEASAGTGKTWSITGLYLRWVLGIGVEPLPVEKILVVTFTNAAVAELRGRLRQRLRDALDVLTGAEDDTFLAELLQEVDVDEARTRLHLALTSMDNAAVYTIHGFCKRLLGQYAFEARLDFDLEMREEGSELRRHAVRDFWRRTAWEKTSLGDLLIEYFADVGQLERQLDGLLRKPDVSLLPDIPLDAAFASARARREVATRLRATWTTSGKDACALLADALQKKILHGNKVRAATVAKTSDEMDLWCRGLLDAPRFEVFSRAWLRERCNKGKDGLVPQHFLFTLIDECLPVMEHSSQIEPVALLAEARRQVLLIERELKGRAGQLSADDLLFEARRALLGPGAEALILQVRERFPVAMVDEFQDTDSVQYAIFSTLYGQGDGALLMIGDPKQAIYGFRGADIYAYLNARHDSNGQYFLGTNFRSTSAMVAAVNRLFAGPDPFVIPELIFQPVTAADLVPPFTGDDERQALHLVLPDEATAAADAATQKDWQAEWIAREIRRLLGNARARIGDRRLQAGDIAVLARSHADAAAVRDALAEQGLPAVYAGRESVVHTEEAADLLLVLAALAEPESGALVRNALACTLLRLPLHTLHHLLHDENAWAESLAFFHDARELWLRRGVLPALYRLFDRYRVLERIRTQVGGERRLTDLLHLCELLQHRHSAGDGPREMLRWLRRQRDDSVQTTDSQKLRLETDAQMVQIVTVHGSKGLQYPVTFVAGMSAAAPARGGRITWYHDETGELRAKYEATDEEKDIALREQLAEDMRLLYVALTRSVYRCYLTIPGGRSLAGSAVAHLLPGDAEQPLASRIEALTGENISFSQTMPVPRGRLAAPGSTVTLQPPAVLPPLRDAWRVTSYTGLTRGLEEAQAAHFVRETAPSDADTTARTLAHFPRGARAGICLHAILENVDFLGRDAASIERTCAEQLAQYGFEAHWTFPLATMVKQVLDTKFGDVGSTSLGSLQWAHPELEFMLAMNRVTASELDAAVQLLPRELPRPSLRFADVEGMLRGFVDLVFIHEGRFWLADYKSNWLGAIPGAYTQALMDQAVAEHRYDIQAALYAVALHRYLRHTVRDYDPGTHFGGIAYLFLRGMDGATPGQGVWLRQPDAQTLARWDALLGGQP